MVKFRKPKREKRASRPLSQTTILSTRSARTSIASIAQAKTEHRKKPGWKDLFAFTTWQHAVPLGFAILATCAMSALKSYLAVALGEIFNVVARFGGGGMEPSEALKEVSKWCLVLAGMGLGTWISNGGFMSTWVVVGELQARSAREEIFSSLLDKDMAWYDSQADGISSLLVRIESQTRELQLATSQIFGFLVANLLTALASLGIAFYYSWKLTLVLLGTLPISFLILHFATAPIEPAITHQKHALSRASKLATASITAIDLVKVFNGFDAELWGYCQAVREATKHYLVQARGNGFQMGYIQFWVISMFVVRFWFGAYLVDRGTDPGPVLTTFYATLAGFQGVEALVPQWLVLSKGMDAGYSLRKIVETRRFGIKFRGIQGKRRPQRCVGNVQLSNVSFAYPSNPSKIVLSRSSFVFGAGDLSFIVGRSGSGKSTIGNLLVNFYEPLSGQITIDNRDMLSLDLEWVRSNVTLIQQSSILFNDTIFQNVAFGLRDPESATAEAVKRACETALFQSTLTSLPKGLNTHVGPGGHNLSGGQKQRLALARARLRDPPVLILDEVTSGLDQVSKVLVMEAIRTWRKGKTTIIITHDVSQIEDEDYVYVMDKSFVVQEGYRKVLIQEMDGLFASLVASASDRAETRTERSMEEKPATPPLVYQDLSPLSNDFLGSKASPAQRLSTYFFNPLDKRGMEGRASFGAHLAYANSMRVSQLWGADGDAQNRVSMRTPTPPNKNSISDSSGASLSNSNRKSSSSRKSSLGSIIDIFRPRKSSFEFVQEMGENIQSSRFSSRLGHARTRSDTYSRTPLTPNILNPVTKQNDGEKSSALKPSSGHPENMSITAILRTVWPNLSLLDRLIFAIGILMCFIAAGINPAFSYCFAQLLGALWATENRMEAGGKWAIMMLVLGVMDGLANFCNRYLLEYTGQSWVNTLRVEALKRILKQPKAWFDKPANNSGKINETLDRNAEEMRNIVGRFLPAILIVAGMVSAALIWALAISWKLTLVALAPGPLVVATVHALSYFSSKWETSCNEGASVTTSITRETILNLRVVRALTLEKYFSKRYLSSVETTFSLGLRRALYTGIFFGLQQSMNLYLTALVFYYGIKLLADTGEVSVKVVLQVVNLLLFSIGASMGILSSIPQISAAQCTAARMLNYASLPLFKAHDAKGAKKMKTPFPIVFHHLAFAYPSRPDQPILRNFSLRLDVGHIYALVGPSACGKSTVMSLLVGLHEPSSAQLGAGPNASPPLTFSGTPVTSLNVQHLRSATAYVPQQPFLFPTTVEENIVYGLPEDDKCRSQSNIHAAAHAAHIHEFIESLPQGYQTPVGDGGQSLSGGQMQRICIARAIGHHPRLLVMDEPTSALDAESAEVVRESIRRLSGVRRKVMSVVIVTHSREVMRMVDRVVVLDDGYVVEEGGYEELMGRKGRFAQMVGAGEWVGGGEGPSAGQEGDFDFGGFAEVQWNGEGSSI